MTTNRSPWIVPVFVIAGVVGVVLAIVLTRGGLEQTDLLAHSFIYGVVAVAFALIALAVYRKLRRSHDAPDEARPKSRAEP